MRTRSVRLSIVILLILGLALTALGFRNVYIDIPGFPAMERGGTGPLGLKLGLDLRGGGHLVYQADTSTRMDVVFPLPGPSAIQTSAEEAAVEPAADAVDATGQDATDATTETPGADTSADSSQPPAETGADATSDSSGNVSSQETDGPPVILDVDVEETIGDLIDADFFHYFKVGAYFIRGTNAA